MAFNTGAANGYFSYVYWASSRAPANSRTAATAPGIQRSRLMKTWMKVGLVIAVAIVLLLALGPLVGGVELGIIAVLAAAAVGVILYRSNRHGVGG